MYMLLPPLLLLASCQAAYAYAVSQVLLLAPQPPTTRSAALRGRFLHITDIHPDPFYRNNASVSSSCHRKKPKNDEERAGYWGAPYTECDSSVRFTNLTLDFLEQNWADDVDFVIWTGDSARHDYDRKMPRTPAEIYELNRGIAGRMEEIFTKRGVPVVPSLGNNDVWPHNILAPGPNAITNEFVKIWETFIPFSSYQVFQRGAYFSTEVIPNKVAAISLNTMYFYDSNNAVGGCEYKDTNDPGNLEFAWLDVQLGLFRDRGMQVWLTGHVPPTPGNFFPECFRRYVELSLRFQDTILGHLYGHMNIDHFFFLDSEDLLEHPESLDEPAKIQKRFSLHKTLRKDFSDLPKASKIDHDEYAIVNVSPSVVANPYLPSFRVFSYNVTGYNDASTEDDIEAEKRKKKKKGSKRKHSHRHGGKKKDCKKKENRDKWECRLPQKKWHSDKHSPSRSNTLWTPLGYSQFYMPDLGTANQSHPPTWELEYLTYRLAALHPHSNASAAEAASFDYPVPPRLLPAELRNVTGLDKSDLAPFKMDDLTIPSWLKLAKKLAEKKKLWKRFKKFMYLES